MSRCTSYLSNVRGTPERRYYIDWLRVLVVLLLLYYHTAEIFDYAGWILKNDKLNMKMTLFVRFVNQWNMAILFFISGVGTWFALEFRTGSQYAQERFKRIFVPVIFGVLVILPLQAYFGHLGHNPNFKGSYIQFYYNILTHYYLDGSVIWAHLWFLVYLFVFSLVSLPIFLYSKKPRQIHISNFAGICSKRGMIFIFGIPLAIIEAVLRPKWPGNMSVYDDWANFCVYLSIFIYGFFLSSDSQFEQAIKSHGKLALVLGTIITILFSTLAWTNNVLSGILYRVLYGFGMWFWVITLLSLGKKYLDVNNRALQYAQEATLPFYILSHPIIVIIGLFVVKWNLSVFEKFLIISTLALIITLAIYDLVIRRIRVMRVLFGMRPEITRVLSFKMTE